MKVTKQETLYHKDHGATLKHKRGKRIVTLSPFLGLFLFGLFLFGLFRGQCSNNDDHHTSIYLQLKNYNSILRTKYDSMWMPPAMYRDMRWLKSDMYKNYAWWLCHKYDVNYMIMLAYDNDGACHKNGTMESCMAIYLGMAMEMP